MSSPVRHRHMGLGVDDPCLDKDRNAGQPLHGIVMRAAAKQLPLKSGIVSDNTGREKKRSEIRRKIMDEAAALFAAEGYDSVSMRKIAQRIGYTPMTIYLYFKDKAELLDCLCEEAFEDLYRRHEHLDATVKDPVERLKAGMRTFVDFALKHPHPYTASFNFLRRKGDRSPRCERMCARAAALERKQVASFLGAGASQREIDLATQIVMTAENGMATMLIAVPNSLCADWRKLVDASADAIVKGLRK
jgi:AcrR family transcriptional regulator